MIEGPTGGIYIVQLGRMPFIKIGFSSYIRARIQQVQQNLPVPVSVIALLPGDLNAERGVHEKLGAWRTRGEWYGVTPELGPELSKIFGREISITSSTNLLDLRRIAHARRIYLAGPPIAPVQRKLVSTEYRVAVLERQLERAQRQAVEDQLQIHWLKQRLAEATATAAEEEGLSELVQATMKEAEEAVAAMEAAYAEPDDQRPKCSCRPPEDHGAWIGPEHELRFVMDRFTFLVQRMEDANDVCRHCGGLLREVRDSP